MAVGTQDSDVHGEKVMSETASTHRVYVVESGDYEQRIIDGIADSIASAVELIKDRYAAPYVVEWGELKPSGSSGCCSVTGKFKAVLNYSTAHTCTFDITPYDVFCSGVPTCGVPLSQKV